MAIETDIIKQYLISFGYQVDKTGEREINSLAASAESLGGNVVAAGLKMAGMVEKIAAMGASVSSLAQDARDDKATFNAYSEAFEQIGVKSSLAAATLATIGNQMQNTGTLAFLKSMQLEGKGAIGTFEKLLDRYKQMQDNRGNAPEQLVKDQFEAMYLKPLGVQSDIFLKAYKNYDAFKQGVAEYQNIQSKSGVTTQTFDELTESEREFKKESFALGLELMKLADKTLPYVNSALKLITDAIVDPKAASDRAKKDITDWSNAQVNAPRAPHLGVPKDVVDNYGAAGAAVWRFFKGSRKSITDWSNGIASDRPSPLRPALPPAAPRPPETPHIVYPMTSHPGLPASTSQPYDAQLAERITQTLMTALQLTREQAAALVGGFAYESSGLKPQQVGDHGTSFGLAQWHADRVALFKRVMGVDVRQASAEKQIEFMVYELKHNKSAVVQMLRAARTDAEMAQAAFNGYEVGKPEQANMAQRLRNAQDIYKQSPTALPQPVSPTFTPGYAPVYGPNNTLMQARPLGAASVPATKPNVTIEQTNHFDIKSTGADPKQIADNVSLMQQRTNRDLYRDFRSEFA